MSDFWLVFIVGLLIYLVYDREKEKRTSEKKTFVTDSLQDMIHKYCEISLKEWLVYIDGDYILSGVITDVDDEWVVIETVKKDKKRTRIIRKTLITGVKEIKQK